MNLTSKDKDQIREWVKVLRSGKYKQGTGCLQPSKTRFCCLGVACKILIPEDKTDIDSYDLLVGAFPAAQFNSPFWLTQINQDVKSKTGTSLTERNDVNEQNFKQIAVLIENLYLKGS